MKCFTNPPYPGDGINHPHTQKTPLETIREELKKRKKHSPAILNEVTVTEKTLLNKIKGITQDLNLNNVTRTKAYLSFYLRHPEIHWAFLGHMVSRNGGWNMTDLKGEFLTKLLAKKERESFFHFLERGNWLIFQDVYPQFLLYDESLRQNRPMFYLLPHLNVSIFMETVWNYFWRVRDTYILCIALVINEQSYLEQRVIQNPYYQTLHQFQSLHERILLGKRLSAILFKNKDSHRQTLDWATRQPHTGSRKDYWPHLFNDVNEGTPGITSPLRLKSCRLRKGARRIYSPKLEYDIVFILIGLPILTMIFLYCFSQANRWGRVGIIICVSLLMPIFEKLAERLGLFVHSDKWMHVYSFFGYLLFFTIISGVYFWLKKEANKTKFNLQEEFTQIILPLSP